MKIDGAENTLTFEDYVQAATIMEAVTKQYTGVNWGTYGITSNVELSEVGKTRYVRGTTDATYAKPVAFEMQYGISSASIYTGAVISGSFSCCGEETDVAKKFSIFQLGQDREMGQITCIAVVDNDPVAMLLIPSKIAFGGKFPFGTAVIDVKDKDNFSRYEVTTTDLRQATSRVKKMILQEGKNKK